MKIWIKLIFLIATILVDLSIIFKISFNLTLNNIDIMYILFSFAGRIMFLWNNLIRG
jgi:hypothetical protein